MTETPHSIQHFLEYLKFQKRYSPHTIRSYQDDLLQFFSFLKRQFNVSAVKEIDYNFIRSWLAEMRSEGIGPRSITRKISSLKSFFKYQVRSGEIEQTPMTKIITPKAGKRLPDFIKTEDADKLISALVSTESWKSLNTKMLITLSYLTGMRSAEMIGLKESQVDFQRSQIKVLGKGNKERIIPVNQDLLGLVREYMNEKKKTFEKTDNVLLVTDKGKKMYPRYAYRLVNEFLSGSEVKTLDKKSPHVLRHTFATHLSNNGANLNAIKELLGHSSLAATQVYTHNAIEKLKDIYKKAHPKA